MSNNPILPIVPAGAGLISDKNVGDEDLLATQDANLDDGETNDSEDTVDEDVREADHVNENLDR
jgi:hypothetical protein